MDSAQANALLMLISDLARIIYAPPPPEPTDIATNGVAVREPVATP